MNLFRTLLILCLVAILSSPLFAQPPGFGGRGGGDRGGRGGDRGGGGRGGFGGGPPGGFSRGGGPGGGSSDFARRMMERMDSDKDGKLEENEVSDRARGFIEAMVRRSGKEFKLPLTIADVAGGGSSRDRGRDRGRDRDRDRKKEDGDFEYPLVRGFGEETAFTAFGVDPNLLNGRAIDVDGTYDDSVKRTLDRTMERYDKDKNGVLEYEEWREIPWQSDPRDSDLDSDGRLTRAEMAERYRLRNSSSGRSSSRSSDRGGSDRSRGGFSGFGGFGGGPPSFGGRGGSSRGSDRGRGGSDRGRGGFNPAEGMLRRVADKNGMIDFSKVDDGMKRMLNRFGVETKGKKKISAILGGKEEEETPKSKVIEGGDRFNGQYSYRKKSKEIKGMPAWWEDKDKNGDSQVTIAEYFTSRSARRRANEIEDFNEMDLNRDGVITPAEAESVDD